MLVSRLYDWGTSVVLEQADPPAHPPGDDVVIELEAAAVTRLDLGLMSGTFASKPELPFTPGTAGVGTVTAGERDLVGRRVLVRGAGVGLERPGTWAERITVPKHAVRVVPQSTDAALAATCYSPMVTGWAAAEPVGRIKADERVLVTGPAGAVGSMCVQMAARAGGRVIALVRDEKEAAAVPATAAEVLVGRSSENMERLGARGGVDAVLDTVGGDTVPTLLPVINPGGRVVMIGYVAGRTPTIDLPTLLTADVRLLPVNMVSRQVPDTVFRNLLTELSNGTLRLNTTSFAFTDLNDALGALTGGGTAGTIAVTM
ncbi:zinc-binding alcohol dehydrogenase family protein [Streptomyces sp. NPDC019396]|uniref:quinone oxidoreductase family protein n=1 Tax=Streptomyces sp. NPDC019396 TaxID=3154687 RepID=UPI00340347D4